MACGCSLHCRPTASVQGLRLAAGLLRGKRHCSELQMTSRFAKRTNKMGEKRRSRAAWARCSLPGTPDGLYELEQGDRIRIIALRLTTAGSRLVRMRIHPIVTLSPLSGTHNQAPYTIRDPKVALV